MLRQNLCPSASTPTVPGKYLVTLSIANGNAVSDSVAYIYKNGAEIAFNETYADTGNASRNALVTTLVDMNGTTDYLEGYVYNNGGTTLSGNSHNTYFTGALIAPVNATAGGWQNDGTQSFLADSTDKVGIGTSTPWAKLSIDAPAGVNSFAIGSSTATYFLVNSSGNVGIGTTSPYRTLSVAGTASFTGLDIDFANAAGVRFNVLANDDYRFNAGGSERMRLEAAGNLGINVNDPSVALDVSGDIEYTGTITDVSDERLKENIQPLAGALALIAQIDGKSFNMKGSTSTEFGFIAQNVQLVLPEAVSIVDPENGYLGVSYLEFIPWLSEAVKELNLKLEDLASTTATSTEQSSFTSRFFASLFARLTQWFADAQNGITDFFARTIHTDELCVGSVCVTEDQFMQVFSPGSQPAAAGSVTPLESIPPLTGQASSEPENPPESEASASSTPSESVTPTESTPPTEEVEGAEESDISEVPTEENANATEAAASPADEPAETEPVPGPAPGPAPVSGSSTEPAPATE